MKEKIEALKTASEYVEKLKAGVLTISDKINNGKEKEAFDLMAYLSDGLEWLMQVIILTKDAQKEEIDIEQLNEKLRKVVEALNNEDFTLVGDMLQYEVLPVLEDISDKIQLTIAN